MVLIKIGIQNEKQKPIKQTVMATNYEKY